MVPVLKNICILNIADKTDGQIYPEYSKSIDSNRLDNDQKLSDLPHTSPSKQDRQSTSNSSVLDNSPPIKRRRAKNYRTLQRSNISTNGIVQQESPTRYNCSHLSTYHPYKNVVPEMCCPKTSPLMQNHHNCNNMRSSISTEPCCNVYGQCVYGELLNLMTVYQTEENLGHIQIGPHTNNKSVIARNGEFGDAEQPISSMNCNTFGDKTVFENENSLTWLASNSSKKTNILNEIDKVFEIFIPAMRANVILPEFVSDLINLHKNNGASEIREISNKRYTLHPNDLLAHFYNLVQSFRNFACLNDTFKDLCHGDQEELLNKNSPLFIMVNIFHFIR